MLGLLCWNSGTQGSRIDAAVQLKELLDVSKYKDQGDFHSWMVQMKVCRTPIIGGSCMQDTPRQKHLACHLQHKTHVPGTSNEPPKKILAVSRKSLPHTTQKGFLEGLEGLAPRGHIRPRRQGFAMGTGLTPRSCYPKPRAEKQRTCSLHPWTSQLSIPEQDTCLLLGIA